MFTELYGYGGRDLIPEKLSDWTIENITEMLSKDLFESERFDYKERLPANKLDKAGVQRLQKSCCAFANSNGGFLVFGVSDDKSKEPKDRLMGIDPQIDFPEKFGNFPKNCTPSIYWDFVNPALPLENGNVVHVVFIPKSNDAPHAVGDNEQGWKFPKRTNKGTEGMSIEEIRHGFLGYYEKKLKLNLLLSELEHIKENAGSWLVTEDKDISKTYSLVTFENTILDSIVTDSYTVLASEEKLLAALHALRGHTRIANNKINIFFSIVGMPLTNKGDLVKEHNEFMHDKCGVIISLCEHAIEELGGVLK